jgi:hypothetical protein
MTLPHFIVVCTDCSDLDAAYLRRATRWKQSREYAEELALAMPGCPDIVGMHHNCALNVGSAFTLLACACRFVRNVGAICTYAFAGTFVSTVVIAFIM